FLTFGIDSVGDTIWRCPAVHNAQHSLASRITKAYLDGFRIINVSWSGSVDTAVANEMISNGVTLICGAGNDTNSNFHFQLAGIDGVIIVSGTDHADSLGPTKLSRMGQSDLCAPGTFITGASSRPEHFNNNVPGTGYHVGHGTSNATAIVSGT